MSITIDLSNLGPLRAASLELADLTLLVGDNNTGKTFFATVVHRTLRARGYSNWTVPRRYMRPPKQVVKWINHVVGELDRPNTDSDNRARNPGRSVVAWADELLEGFLSDFGRAVRSSIEYAFGTQASNLRRRTPSRHAIDCYLRINNRTPQWEVEVRFDGDSISVTSPDARSWLIEAFDSDQLHRSEPAQILLQRLSFSRDFPSGIRDDLESPFVWEALYEYLENTLFPDWPPLAVHLPSGRTGIMHSYHVLAANVVQQSAAAGIRPIGIEPLPGTAADFLSLILSPKNIRYRSKPSKVVQAVINKIESEMRAKVVVARTEGQPVDSVVVMTPEGQFSLWRTSSMISELAPLVLVLKHSIGSRGHVTIDEPESHLHPKMQRQIASCLAHLVNEGKSVLITTHSDYFVNSISNMIRTDELRSSRRHRTYGRLPRIDRQRVKALRFSRESRWCTADPVDITPLNGIDDSTFTDVMEEQYYVTADLIDELLRNDFGEVRDDSDSME